MQRPGDRMPNFDELDEAEMAEIERLVNSNFNLDDPSHQAGMGLPPMPNMPNPPLPADVVRKLNQTIAHERAEYLKHREKTDSSSEFHSENTSDAQISEPASSTTEPSKARTIPGMPSEKNYAAMMHLSSLSMLTGIPFVNVIFPAMMWLARKDDSKFINYHGRILLNFQLTMSFLMLVCLFFGAVMFTFFPDSMRYFLEVTRPLRVVFYTGFKVPANIFTILPFFIACYFPIFAAMDAYNGKKFSFPLSIKFFGISKKDCLAKTSKTLSTEIVEQVQNDTEQVQHSTDSQSTSQQSPPSQEASTSSSKSLGKFSFG